MRSGYRFSFSSSCVVLSVLTMAALWATGCSPVLTGVIAGETGGSATDEPADSDGVVPFFAEYEVTFVATWSAERHPTNFPGGAHFTELVGATHNGDIVLWEPGGLASPGIESMAETGSQALLIREVEAAITAGTAGMVITGGGTNAEGEETLTFAATQDHSRATITTMIAPSPDWFVGVNSVELFENGQWVDERVIALQPYDSGTDSGVNYISSNQDTNPPEPIFEITGPPLSNGGRVLSMGTMTFRRIGEDRSSTAAYDPGS